MCVGGGWEWTKIFKLKNKSVILPHSLEFWFGALYQGTKNGDDLKTEEIFENENNLQNKEYNKQDSSRKCSAWKDFKKSWV